MKTYFFDHLFNADNRFRSTTVKLWMIEKWAEEEDAREGDDTIKYHLQKKESWFDKFLNKIYE